MLGITGIAVCPSDLVVDDGLDGVGQHQFTACTPAVDTLPYDWDHLYKNRHYLCEYCFFGGPDKKKPFPQEDWF